MTKGSLETRTQASPGPLIGRETHPPAYLRSTKSAKWTWESATQVAHLSDIIRLRAAGWLTRVAKLTLSWQAPHAARVGSLKSPGLRGTGGLAVGNLAAAHIGRRQKRL